MMSNREVLGHEVPPREQPANSYYSKHAKFDLMSVRVSCNARVTKIDNEPVPFSIFEYEGLVGDPTVATKPAKSFA